LTKPVAIISFEPAIEGSKAATSKTEQDTDCYQLGSVKSIV
jgi:hypothetical protein